MPYNILYCHVQCCTVLYCTDVQTRTHWANQSSLRVVPPWIQTHHRQSLGGIPTLPMRRVGWLIPTLTKTRLCWVAEVLLPAGSLPQ